MVASRAILVRARGVGKETACILLGVMPVEAHQSRGAAAIVDALSFSFAFSTAWGGVTHSVTCSKDGMYASMQNHSPAKSGTVQSFPDHNVNYHLVQSDCDTFTKNESKCKQT